MSEWRALRRSPGPLSDIQIARSQERADRLMTASISREMARAERGLGILATIGTSAPFIGLFGTVWGIMNAFRGIAASKDTNLAVVAPGIAEALFATALGLVAAIPAVIFYNKIAGDLDRFTTRLEVFTDDFLARMSRRLGDGN
jgi:biopolymer transport protein TolQ